MAGTKQRGRKRAAAPNVSQRAAEPKRPNSLPTQYDFTPAAPNPPNQSTQEPVRGLPQPSTPAAPHFRDFPPPLTLFQNSANHQLEEHGSPQVQNNPYVQSSHSPSQGNSQPAQSHPSSQGNNFEEDDEDAVAELQEDSLRELNALLTMPGRDSFVTVLSPTPTPNTQWFTRDVKSRLVRKITKVFTNKFNAPYYSWSCVPQDKKERLFLEFAKTHTWDPLITGTVHQHFETICGRRMKDMVSNVRTSRERPKWIKKTLWKTMIEYWNTEEAQQKSLTYSKCRMSDRNGLGPHIHLSGPTSFQERKGKMEQELGRPVNIGEVFVQTHTKPDGTFVDGKAKDIALIYEKNLEEKLAEIQKETSCVSDGASRPRELTADECNAIFLQATQKDSRGIPYGIGSINLENAVTPNQPGDSSKFVTLEEKLKEAQRLIEQQAKDSAKREDEHSKVVAEHQGKLKTFSLVEEYLRETDPAFLDFLASRSAEQSTTRPLSTSPPTTRPSTPHASAS